MSTALFPLFTSATSAHTTTPHLMVLRRSNVCSSRCVRRRCTSRSCCRLGASERDLFIPSLLVRLNQRRVLAVLTQARVHVLSYTPNAMHMMTHLCAEARAPLVTSVHGPCVLVDSKSPP